MVRAEQPFLCGLPGTADRYVGRHGLSDGRQGAGRRCFRVSTGRFRGTVDPRREFGHLTEHRLAGMVLEFLDKIAVVVIVVESVLVFLLYCERYRILYTFCFYIS